MSIHAISFLILIGAATPTTPATPTKPVDDTSTSDEIQSWQKDNRFAAASCSPIGSVKCAANLSSYTICTTTGPVIFKCPTGKKCAPSGGSVTCK